MAAARVWLPAGSPPPSRAATVIARASFVKSLPRFASVAAFLGLIDAHLEWPAMCRFYEWILPQLPTLESVQTLRSAGIWIGMPNAIAVGVGAHRESLSPCRSSRGLRKDLSLRIERAAELLRLALPETLGLEHADAVARGV